MSKLRRLLPRSLRSQLLAWVGVLLVCLLAGFEVAVYRLEELSRVSEIDRELELRVGILGRAIREAAFIKRPNGPGFDSFPPPPPPEERPTSFTLPETGPGGYYYVVWFRDGTVLARSPAAPGNVPEPGHDLRDTIVHWRTRNLLREAFHCSGFGDCGLAGRSIEPEIQAHRSFVWKLIGAGLVVLAAGLGGAWWIISRAIRPINTIGETATRISQGNLAERIPVPPNASSEIEQLGSVLNSSFARLERVFAQQRQFTADAAHELRTPLAVLIAETQTTLSRERTAAEYRDSVEVCLSVAQGMRRLTDSLLQLSRVDSDHQAITREKLDLETAVWDCIERVRPLAAQHGVSIHTDLQPAYAFTNPDRIRQVILNLLVNAVTYNISPGEIRVATSSTSKDALLTVADSGVGIDPGDLPQIFDRFWRADKARSRANGHAGLGLAICKAILDAEHGTIDVASIPGVGTTFTVRFPCVQDEL